MWIGADSATVMMNDKLPAMKHLLRTAQCLGPCAEILVTCRCAPSLALHSPGIPMFGLEDFKCDAIESLSACILGHNTNLQNMIR